ncbi:HAD family hydrolase [Longimonas halophila]|uniref:phosphoglycolate phosphatase n=1 Tax=Longimonas halophila TaxID=1469170 RepID=A0A2H3P4L9_9BACT|nr:HAD family hydrolase [Longimonas halophila]PEN09459.1 HAD family hydrolase [Longimonas halophila]
MKLLLFDIDGTLLHANGSGRVAIEHALADVFDRPIATDEISFSGRTDPGIMRDILESNGIAPSTANVKRALNAYQEVVLQQGNPGDVTLIPGIPPLLDKLAERTDVTLALLTGNVRATAFWKLDAVGLDRHFAFGAFGSDDGNRHNLPPVAVRRAQQHTGRTFVGSDVVIIGDTPHDIQCGRGIGAFSVGVCTGSYERSMLEPHRPNVLFDTLQDTEAFVQRVVEL